MRHRIKGFVTQGRNVRSRQTGHYHRRPKLKMKVKTGSFKLNLWQTNYQGLWDADCQPTSLQWERIEQGRQMSSAVSTYRPRGRLSARRHSASSECVVLADNDRVLIPTCKVFRNIGLQNNVLLRHDHVPAWVELFCVSRVGGREAPGRRSDQYVLCFYSENCACVLYAFMCLHQLDCDWKYTSQELK